MMMISSSHMADSLPAPLAIEETGKTTLIGGYLLEDAEERRADHVRLDLKAIGDLLQPLFPGHVAESARLIAGGKCNSNYRVTVSGRSEPVLLRIYGHDPSACALERSVHERVKSRVPVPEPLWADETIHDGGWSFAVYSWVEGVRLDRWLVAADFDEIERVARDVGKAWAEIGAFRFPLSGFLDGDLKVVHPVEDWFEFLFSQMEEWLFRGSAGRRLGESLTRDLWALVSENRRSLDGEETRSLTHSDFRPENMLVREGADGWELAAVLDWEFAGSGASLMDLGLLFREEDLLPPNFEPSFAQGVEASGGRLPIQWKRKSRLIDFVCLVQLLDSAEERPVWHRRILERIASVLDRWDRRD